MSSIVIVSDNPEKIPAVKHMQKKLEAQVLATRGYKASVERLPKNSFIYFDYSSFSDRQKTMLLKYLAEQEIFEYGIFDPLNEIEDPARLFHDGASDYIGKTLAKSAICKERIQDALGFYHSEEGKNGLTEKDYSWTDIVPGNEYPFIMLFMEIDILPQWKSKSGKHVIEKVMKQFYSHISKTFEPLGGKLWIHTDFGGLLLFPCNKTNGLIVRECVKLMINRVLISCEVYDYDALITYRLSLTSGETEYQVTGDTGTLISDSLNFIFHLGQRFTPKGTLIVTDDVLEIIPDGLKDLFVFEAEFQGKQAYSMVQQKPR